MQSLLFDVDNDSVNDNLVEKKVCIKCNRSLPLSAFSKRGGENYLRTECKECLRKQVALTNQLKKIHGLPPTDYICPICEKNGENVVGGPRQRNGKSSRKFQRLGLWITTIRLKSFVVGYVINVIEDWVPLMIILICCYEQLTI